MFLKRVNKSVFSVKAVRDVRQAQTVLKSH